MKSLLLTAGLILVLTPFGHAADALLVPPAGGTPLFQQDIESGFYLTHNSPYGEMALVPVKDVPFAQAVEMQSHQAAPEPWEFQIGQKVPAAIKKGDVLWISLW